MAKTKVYQPFVLGVVEKNAHFANQLIRNFKPKMNGAPSLECFGVPWDAYSYNPSFECFSRARQNLIVIIYKKYFEKDNAFQNATKEILTHGQKCENETCKENGWNKLIVVDVEYIGLTHDEIESLFDPSVCSESEDSDESDNNVFDECLMFDE